VVILFQQLRVLEALANMVVVVADGDGEDFLGFLLLDDVAVEVVADLPWLEMKVADAAHRLRRFGVLVFAFRTALSASRSGRPRGSPEGRAKLDVAAAHSLLELFLEFFKRRLVFTHGASFLVVS
jgi:hypothetical protein